MDADRIYKFVADKWDSTIVPTLCEYIRIPNQSPGATRFSFGIFVSLLLALADFNLCDPCSF
jgi:hypothetical protein